MGELDNHFSRVNMRVLENFSYRIDRAGGNPNAVHQRDYLRTSHLAENAIDHGSQFAVMGQARLHGCKARIGCDFGKTEDAAEMIPLFLVRYGDVYKTVHSLKTLIGSN